MNRTVEPGKTNSDLPDRTAAARATLLAPQEEPASTSDVAALAAVALRRWKLIAAIALSTMLATYEVMRLVPSLYKSSVEILVFDPQRQSSGGVQKQISPFDVDNAAMNTEIAIIKSKSLGLRVVERLHLDDDQEFQRRSFLLTWLERLGLAEPGGPKGNLEVLLSRIGLWPSPGRTAEPTPAERIDHAAQMLRRLLHVERMQFSYVLKVEASSRDPAKAQRLATAISEEYLTNQQETRQDTLQRGADWLKGRVGELETRVLQNEASIAKLKASSGLSDTDGGNLADQQVSGLDAELMRVRAEVADRRARLDQARRMAAAGRAQSIPEVASSSIINQLRGEKSKLAVREAELRSGLRGTLAEHDPSVAAIRAQLAAVNAAIDTEANRTLEGLQTSYDTAVQHEQSLAKNLQKLAATRDSDTYAKLQQLRHVAEADRRLYESYLAQFNEITARQVLRYAGARIIAPATLPDGPSSPRRMLFYALAGILGTIIGILLALLRERREVGVRTGDEVEQRFGYPVIGAIPLLQTTVRRQRATHGALVHNIVEAPLSGLSDALNTVRVGLKLLEREHPPKVILITSSIPGEGKSAVSMLLAASSAMAGQRTLLLDCDLRHRSVSDAFDSPRRGLTDVLLGTATAAEVTIEDASSNISVLPAGSVIPNPADLLTSPRMRDLMAQLREQYEYIVIDTSPVLPVVDALALTAMADKILVIAEWSRTPRDSLGATLKRLRPQAHRVAGVLLNKVDLKRAPGSVYGYGYGYGAYPYPTGR